MATLYSVQSVFAMAHDSMPLLHDPEYRLQLVQSEPGCHVVLGYQDGLFMCDLLKTEVGRNVLWHGSLVGPPHHRERFRSVLGSDTRGMDVLVVHEMEDQSQGSLPPASVHRLLEARQMESASMRAAVSRLLDAQVQLPSPTNTRKVHWMFEDMHLENVHTGVARPDDYDDDAAKKPDDARLIQLRTFLDDFERKMKTLDVTEQRQRCVDEHYTSRKFSKFPKFVL